ncbi:MAG: hypothetical protein ACYYK0_04835 [Candidatus Eutrophobiaceae bacterium]
MDNRKDEGIAIHAVCFDLRGCGDEIGHFENRVFGYFGKDAIFTESFKLSEPRSMDEERVSSGVDDGVSEIILSIIFHDLHGRSLVRTLSSSCCDRTYPTCKGFASHSVGKFPISGTGEDAGRRQFFAQSLNPKIPCAAQILDRQGIARLCLAADRVRATDGTRV